MWGRCEDAAVEMIQRTRGRTSISAQHTDPLKKGRLVLLLMIPLYPGSILINWLTWLILTCSLEFCTDVSLSVAHLADVIPLQLFTAHGLFHHVIGFFPCFSTVVLLPISSDKLEKNSISQSCSSWIIPVISSFASVLATDKADTVLSFLSWNSKFIHQGLPNQWLLITQAHHNTCSHCISSWLASATKQWVCSFLKDKLPALSTLAWLWYSSGYNAVFWRWPELCKIKTFHVASFYSL